MRLAGVHDPALPANGSYRVIEPLLALQRLGHDVLLPPDSYDVHAIEHCDAVIVHRQYGPNTDAAMAYLRAAGVGIVYDNDDELRSVPAETPGLGGLRPAAEWEQDWQALLATALRADVVTTTSAPLARAYAEAGARDVRVLPNRLGPDWLQPIPTRGAHDDVTVGWTAGTSHAAELPRIDIQGPLSRLLARHPRLRVASIGVDLELRSSRYQWIPGIQFADLAVNVAVFDVGLAPLSDIPFNLARADSKVKEYAARGVPWLASGRGPFAALGEREGGRHVADDGWEAAIERLLTRPGERFVLARQGRAWAEGELVDLHAQSWLDALQTAAGAARR
jgi:hypothetical protein